MSKPFIGQMNRKIALVEVQATQSATGSEKTTDVTVCEPYAAMIDVSGNEDVEGKVIHLFSRTYTIRARSEVKSKGTKLIVIDGDARFEIIHIKEIGKTHLEILCKNNE
jgi:head-tail adaptor